MPTSKKSTTLSRNQLRRVFLLNYGAAAALARDLKTPRATITNWFEGRVISQRIEDAIRARATELASTKQKAPARLKNSY